VHFSHGSTDGEGGGRQDAPSAGDGECHDQGESGLLTLTKVHLVPALHSRLISVPHLTAKGFEVLFKGEDCTLSRGGKVWMRAKKVRGKSTPCTK